MRTRRPVIFASASPGVNMIASANHPGVLDTVRAVKSGRLTPQASIAACHARAKALEATLHAFVDLPDLRSYCGGLGPLAGVAVGVKDLIDTVELPTTYGSPIFAAHQPSADAWIVARLREMSATVLGKTVTTEFAWRYPGPTRNPWNLSHSPGGSSSGSAAAVASGSLPVALGTQTMGSVLRPAAYCGIVGFKPSFGSISRDGVHSLSGSLDHVGLFTRSVDDAAYVVSRVMGGPGARQGAAFVVDVDGLEPHWAPRIGILPLPSSPAIDPCQSDILSAAAICFQQAGATVEDCVLPAAYTDLVSLAITLCDSEGAANFADLVARHPDKISSDIKALVERGTRISAIRYINALKLQQSLRQGFTSASAPFDVVLTVPATGEAPVGLNDTGNSDLCAPWTALGVPAISLPAGRGPNGLPLGIQLVAPYGYDLKLLRIAKWCETALAHLS